MAVDGGHVYWTWTHVLSLFETYASTSVIGRANLDGSGQAPSFITGPGDAAGLAVDGGHVYWVNGGRIGRANLDGSGVEQSFIATVVGEPLG